MRPLSITDGITLPLALAFLTTSGSAQGNSSKLTTFMVVGDSISQGFEGDYTWRYRLWEWFREQQVNATFIGPYNGTFPQQEGVGPICDNITETLPSHPPRRAFSYNSYPFAGAGYAKAISSQDWPNAHLSRAGQQARLVKLKHVAARYQPDYILLALGINDLNHHQRPEETILELHRIIEEGRAAKPDVRFAVATISKPRVLPGLALSELLPSRSEQLTELIEASIAKWNTEASPVSLVRLHVMYGYTNGASSASWDGVHPNELGEYQIASAFSQTLHKSFGFGSSPLSVPAEVDVQERPNSVPDTFEVEAVPWGIKVTWAKVYGAYKYEITRRRANTTDKWQLRPSGNGYKWSSNRYDALDIEDGEEWEFRVRTNNGEALGGLRLSNWSMAKSAIAHPTTNACQLNFDTQVPGIVQKASGIRLLVLVTLFGFLVFALGYEVVGRVLVSPSWAYMPLRNMK